MGTLEQNQGRDRKAKRRFLAVWTTVGGILLTGVVLYLLNVLSVPVGIIIWSTIIVFCLRGPVNKLEKMGLNRAVGTTVAYLGMFIVLALVGLLLFSPAFGLGGQFTDLLNSIPGYITAISDWGNAFYERYANIFQNETVKDWMNQALAALATWASTLARDSASGVVAIGTGVVNSFMALGFALVVAFWILLDLPALGRECRRLFGEKRKEVMDMLHVTFTRIMGGYIKGTLLQCAIIGVGCAVWFGVIGVPNYAALGGIAGLLNIIPIVGPWLGGALAAVVGVFVGPWVAIAALVGTIVIQQVVYTFVSPKIMASSVDVHPALTMLALLAGSAIGGAMSGFVGTILGMLASIPAVAVAKAIFVYYFEKRTGRRILAEDGVFFKGTARASEHVDPVADGTTPRAAPSAAPEQDAQHEAEPDEKQDDCEKP